MKRAFLKKAKFTDESHQLIGVCNETITEYLAMGLRLTLRQLYYQLVSKNILSNEDGSYKRLGKVLSRGRLAGLVDWDGMEDRVRAPQKAPEWGSLRSLINSATNSYRLPRFHGQEEYVELWCEKDALAGVLEPISEKYHIVLMVNRGYSSQSAMYESAIRINDAIDEYRCNYATILYVGDLDPSGEDMARDISDRMEMFKVNVDIVKIALNLDQVEEHGLPHNPAKLSDSRARKFIKKYGRRSWEVDALPPSVLQELATEAVSELVDMELMQETIEQENEDKKRLQEATKGL